MKMKTVILIALAMITGAFASPVDSSAKSVSMNDFKKELKNNKSLVVLDVRTSEELEGTLGKIEGSINIPLQQLENRIGELEKYKVNDIRVISRSGIPSKLATEILISHGFKAANVIGGMMAFR